MSASFPAPPPSYEDATSPTASAPPSHFSRSSSTSPTADMADAVLIFFIPDGVQIFFITPEGYVSAPSYPSSLAIYRFVNDDVVDGAAAAAGNKPDSLPESPPAFLQIGDWMYPLMPGHSPALHASWGAYVFPDVTASEPDTCVGVILPESVGAEERKEFEAILESLTRLLQQQTEVSAAGEQPQKTSQLVSSVLVTAADWISWGLIKGAENAGKLMKFGSTKLRENMSPTSEPSHIDPRAERGAYYARRVSHGAVKVSGYLVTKLGEGTAALGRYVAPHVRRHGENLLPRSLTRRSPDGSSTIDSVAEVAASGLQGVATVYTSLEHSAKILAKSLSQETVYIVQHKYGTDAGRFAEDIVHTVTGVAAASYNFGHLGIKAVAKQVAASATVAVAQSYPKTPGASPNVLTTMETSSPDPEVFPEAATSSSCAAAVADDKQVGFAGPFVTVATGAPVETTEREMSSLTKSSLESTGQEAPPVYSVAVTGNETSSACNAPLLSTAQEAPPVYSVTVTGNETSSACNSPLPSTGQEDVPSASNASLPFSGQET